MADQEALAILKQGVEVWNNWRSENFEKEIDLSEADLRGANLRGTNLRKADLSGADLRAAKFYMADIDGVNFRRANLSGLNLSEADLRSANLIEVNLNEANLSQQNLSGLNLSGAILSGINLSEANLSGAILSRAILSGAILSGAILKNADLSDSNLINANLSTTESDIKITRWRSNDILYPGADLSNAKLVNADLSGANLSRANLSGTNLSGANLSGTNLSGANLSGANLSRANLIGANLSGQNFSRTSLIGANLSGQNLRGTNLSGVNLSWANIREANLSQLQALGTNFTSANLTGACLQDWNINSETNFTDVICDYIYLKEGQKERRPSDPIANFAPGDFVKLVQKSLETVDLIFADGIDWTAFIPSFEKLIVEYGEDNLHIQAIEKKSGGSFVIRLEVPPEANKGEIERHAKELYENQINVLKTTYNTELQAKDREISIYRQHNASLENIIYTLANKPIQVVATAQSQNELIGNNSRKVEGGISMTGDRNISTGGGNYNERIQGDYVQGNKYAGQPQSLAEAAAEIQSLLKQLEQTYPTGTTSEKMVVAAQAVEQIQSNPLLKQRVINAIKEGSLAAFEKAIDNPIGAFVVHAIEGWQEV